MEIRKVAWKNSDNHVRFTLPMTKVDEEKREVSGFASLDNADAHDDIVLADASARAFSRFRGNIREMHQPVAVGKMVDFKEDEYFDPEANTTYKGIYVTVKVSKGAQDTWEKVLDGTLTGFSIGGNIIDAEQTILKSEAGGKDRSIRLIKDYDLEELSLVDNPANQLANVFSIQKTKDGQELSGMIVEKSSEIVFFCKKDGITKTSTEDTSACPVCGNPMHEAGWIEYSDGEEKISKIGDVLKSFSTEEAASDPNSEGGVEMQPKVEKTVTQPESEESNIDPVEQGKAETEVESSVEEVSEVEEVEPAVEEEVVEVENETDELHKMLTSLREDLSGDLQKNFGALEDKITAVNKSFDEFGTKINDRFTEFESKHAELSQKIATLKTDLDSVEKSIGTLTKSTAKKDSGDLGGSSDAIRKSADSTGSIWRGTFLSTDYLD